MYGFWVSLTVIILRQYLKNAKSIFKQYVKRSYTVGFNRYVDNINMLNNFLTNGDLCMLKN